jgi:hypothetical protein
LTYLIAGVLFHFAKKTAKTSHAIIISKKRGIRADVVKTAKKAFLSVSVSQQVKL